MIKFIGFIALCFFSQILNAQFEYNPFEYDLTEKAPAVEGNPAEENEDAVYIFNKTLVWYGQLPETEYLIRAVIVHKMIYLNSEKAIDEYNKIYISASGRDSLHAFRVRVIENGNIVREFDKKDLKESVEDENRKLRMLAVEGLKKGQMIERLSIELEPFVDYGTIAIQDDYPTLSRYVSIACPTYLEFSAKSYGFDAEFKDTVFKENETRYLFADAGRINPFKKEFYVFQDAREWRIEFSLEQNYVTRSKINSWADKGRNLMEALTAAENVERRYVDKLITKQKWKELSGQRQLYEIDTYIKTNVNQSSEYPFVGNVEKLFKQKYGDKYSVVRVYILIFQALNIDWQLAFSLPKTSKVFDPDFPSNVYINNPLFYFPALKSFLDPTDFEYRAGEISYLYEGQKAMFVKPMKIGDGISGVTRIDQIPESHRSHSLRSTQIHVGWDDEMNAIIKTTSIGSGHAVDSRKIIYTLNEKEKADQFIEEITRADHKEGVFTIEDVQNFNLNNYDEYIKPIEMKYSWTTDVFNESAGNNLLFNYGMLIGKQIELYNEKERENPIDFYYPHDHKVVLEVEIPEGYTAKGIENKNKHIEHTDSTGKELFGIDIQVSEKDHKIVLEIFEYYSKDSFQPDVYDKFREVINAAADVNAYNLLLEKK